METQRKYLAAAVRALHSEYGIPLVGTVGVVVAAAFVRFDGITRIGITRGDSFGYLHEAKLWAFGGKPTLGEGLFYRPGAYLPFGLALRIGGYNDYSIKVLNASADILNVMLIIAIGYLLTRKILFGLCAAVVYAFLPAPIYFARSEYVHTLSTSYVLIGCLLFVCAMTEEIGRRREWLRRVLVAGAGGLTGTAASTHADLALIAPGYVACLLGAAKSGATWRNAGRTFFADAGAFSLGFLVPYIAGMVAFSPGTVLSVLREEYSLGMRHVRSDSGTMPKALLVLTLLRHGLGLVFGKHWFMPILIVLTPVVMSSRVFKGKSDSVSAFVPPALVASYVILFALALPSFGPNHGRLFLPVAPLVILGCLYWAYRGLDGLGKGRAPIFVALALVLVWQHPRTTAGERNVPQPYRAVWDVLKGRVGPEQRLLIAPAAAYWSDAGFRHELYFGPDAEYLVELPLEGEYSVDALARIVREGRFAYLFVSNDIEPRIGDEDLPLSAANKSWLRNEQIAYNVESDLSTIQSFLTRYDAKLIASTSWGPVYALDVPPTADMAWSLHTNHAH